MERFFKLAILAVCLMAVYVVALADKPPQPLFQHITTTSTVVHKGTCKVDSLGIKDTKCLIYRNPSLNLLWIVLFDDQIEVTRILGVKEDTGEEATAWCRNDVCS